MFKCARPSLRHLIIIHVASGRRITDDVDETDAEAATLAKSRQCSQCTLEGLNGVVGYRGGADLNDFSPPSTLKRRENAMGGAIEESPPIDLVRGYPLASELTASHGGGDHSRHSTMRSGVVVGDGLEYPTVRSGRSGRFAPPPTLGSLTAVEPPAARSRPGTLERRRAEAEREAETEVNVVEREQVPEPGPRTLERRRREDDATIERRRREAEAENVERERRPEGDSAEERARERLYEPPIIQFGRGGAGGVSYFQGGNRHPVDNNLKSFSPPQRR